MANDEPTLALAESETLFRLVRPYLESQDAERLLYQQEVAGPSPESPNFVYLTKSHP